MDFCYKIFLVQLGEKKGYNVRKKEEDKGKEGKERGRGRGKDRERRGSDEKE